MPLSERHSQEIAGQRKCQNLTPSVWQQFVETYDAMREAKNTICRFTFREYRLSRVKINRGSEPLKFPPTLTGPTPAVVVTAPL